MQDDDGGFEIASYRGSLDDIDEDHALDTGTSEHNSQDHIASTTPPKPNPTPPSRQSLDGETIFAVGEDGDKWSEDEDAPDRHGKGEGAA